MIGTFTMDICMNFSSSSDENDDFVLNDGNTSTSLNTTSINLRNVRRNLREKSNIFLLPDRSFINRFRLSKEAFKYVLDRIALFPGMRSTSISPIIKLSLTLEVLAGGSYQWTTSNDFIAPVAQSTLSYIIDSTTTVIENVLCNEWIYWKRNVQEDQKVKEFFYNKFGIPGVIGVIDGTHFDLVRPTQNEEMFFNRKGHHSINCMLICDHKLTIKAIFSKFGGASHDSFVWNNSEEKKLLEYRFKSGQDRNCWLLGDSGYPLEPWLITPYRNPSANDELNFNTLHSSARSIIERCNGVLKGRWRILLGERKCKYSPQKLIRFGNVCAALHNICIKYKVPLAEDNIVQSNSVEYHCNDNSNLNSTEIKKYAVKYRNRIKTLLWSKRN